MRKKRQALAAAAALLLGLLMMIPGCYRLGAGQQVSSSAAKPARQQPVSPLDFQLTNNTEPDFLPFSISDPAPRVCLDAQLYPGIQHLDGVSFQPLTLVTVVFVIDRAQTDLRPDSWAALLASGLPVSYPSSEGFGPVTRSLTLAAIAYGLDGEDYTKASALAYLRTLQDKGLLQNGTENAPAAICLDTQAMAWASQGRDLAIVIPRDGTLSFACGLFGPAGMELPAQDALLHSGLRLLDGRCLHPSAPNAEAYRHARRVTDFEKLTAEIKDFRRDYRRSVLRVRLLSTADIRENIMAISLVVFLIIGWTATALYRSARRDMRRCIWLVSVQTIAWLLLSSYKYMCWEDSLITRLCWYGYYPFLLGLPLVSLYTALTADRATQTQPLPRWFRAAAGLYPALVLFVFTNDFHQLVFQFDFAGNWSDRYTYGIGYYLVFAYAILCFLLSIGIMIHKSKSSPKHHAWVGPVLIAGTTILFNLLYIFRVPLAREAHLPLVFSLFSIFFMESVLHAGLIPSNNKYKQLFSASALNMQLLDQRGAPVLSAAAADPLTRLQCLRILDDPAQPLQKDENTLLHSRPIPGGIVVWEEDLTSLHTLQKRLHRSIGQTREANLLLQKESQILHQKLTSEVNAQLFQALESDIDDKIHELTQAIHSLTDGPQRETQLAYITLLLCHIKRRCNLFFLSQEGKDMSGNELAVYLDELSEFASYAGIHALTRSGISGPVSICTGTLCYDFYYSLLSWAIQSSRATLLGQVEQKNGEIIFGVLASEDTADVVFSDSFRAHAQAVGARLSRHTLEESEGIYLTFPRKGGQTV